MLPISVDLEQIRVVLVGNGNAAQRRLRLLDEAGTGELEVYASVPGPALVAAAGARLCRRLPQRAEIARAQLIFIAGLADSAAAEISRIARAAGVLVNVEDDPRRSDFHSAAVIRRGDLSVAISTGGRSPGLAALMRAMLEQRFGPEWEVRLDEIAALRRGWRAAGVNSAAIGRLTREWIGRHGWLDPPPDASQPPTQPIA